MITKIKAYLSIFLGFLVMALTTKAALSKAAREKKRAERAKANLDQQKKIQRADNVIEAQFHSRRAAAKAEIKDGRKPSVFSNPNGMFDNENSDG